jgi:hypothetical protein
MKQRSVDIPILLIEDNLQRIKWFDIHLLLGFRLVVAKNGGSALGMIERDPGYVYGGILLDHDLHLHQLTFEDRNLSGSQIINQIIAKISKNVPVLIHSMNPGKAPAMVRKLESAGFSAVSRISWYAINTMVYHEWLEEVRKAWSEKDD